jgi:pyruvate/2-oxoglutarate dehydrogenase complex dihydrolipoamide dehydrogenase (E3) component
MSTHALKQVDKQLNDHERRMLEHVAPPDWLNPEPADRYHLVVVGAGPAGLVAAAGAAGLGARVALVEKSRMGGDCLNYGCVPSKGLIRAARAWTEARRAHGEFGAAPVHGRESFETAIERMRSLRADLSHHDSAARYTDLGVDVFLGEGRFTGRDTLEVGGQTLRFKRALISTGARAAAPPIPGLEDAGYLTNETLFSIAEQPRRLAVIGAGPIGCEMSQSFARFGTEVTLLDMSDHVLAREDADAAEIVQRSLLADGVRLEMGVEIAGVEVRDGAKLVTARRGGETVEIAADEILVAAGRAPNVETLGLEQAGVEYDRKGVEVDDRLRTSNRKIYAAGDVASAFKFTHTADAQARIVIQNALFLGRKKATGMVVPWVTYTSPEIAHVGLTHDQANQQGIEVETVTVGLDGVDRAVLDGEDAGFVRLYVRKGKDTVVGATLVAEHAGEMAGELAVIVGAGVGLSRLAEVIHPYPTQAEVIKKAADAWRRQKLTPRVKRLFDWWFRVTA